MLTVDEKRELAGLLHLKEVRRSRQDLFCFTQHTKPNFTPNWFHEKYYSKLNDFACGIIKKLMVFVPPQHGKSEGSTRRLPAFCIGNNPEERVAIVSYSAAKARKFNREIQRIIEDPSYKEVFPEIKLSNSADGYARTFDEFEIVGHEGSIKTVGVGGALTGEPVDKLIMDDLYKDWASAQSDLIREGIQDWYDSVAESRLHNNSQQLLVFTRWHEHDLAGYLLEKEPDDWEVIVYPAIKLGGATEEDPRIPGEALWPERHSVAKLRNTEKRNTHNFETLYQQNPKPKEGLMFPESEITRYDPLKIDVEARAEYKYSFIDPAGVAGGDDLSMPVGYLIENKIYIVDVIYNNDGTDLNGPACVEMIVGKKLNHVEVESVSGWLLFGKEIRTKVGERHSDCAVRMVKATNNKHTRIFEASAFIKNHMVFREDYKELPQYEKFIKVLTSYLKVQKQSNPKDDAPDSLAGMATFFRNKFKHIF